MSEYRDKTAPAATQAQMHRPNLTFFHPNPKGTGGALRLELHPAHDRVSGSIMMSVANQLTIGDRRGPVPTFPTFDWENKIVVKLDFDDLCKFLQVFRGECESIDGDRGLYHSSPRASTCIKLRHLVDPISGYSLELYRSVRGSAAESRAHIILNSAESHGLCEAIAGSMSVISFGIPMVIPHDTSAYEAEKKARRDGYAA